MALARHLLFVLLLLIPLASAQEWREVVTPRTRVLFSDRAIEEYALRVATRAESALDVLAELFGVVPDLTTISLDGRTDLYNAIAPPLPRPRVVMPALFPAHPQVDLGTRDPLYALLLHELTHVVQLTYLEHPPGAAPLPRLGLVGEAVAPLPPGWLLEGLAVWVAGEYAPGSAVVDARTRGVLHSLALEGEWPTLEDVSLLSHAEWPGGEARYLLGGAFVGFLIEEYGWDTLLASLREANAGWYALPFEVAWRRAAGVTLEGAWQEWSARVEEAAVARALRWPDRAGVVLTEGGVATTVLAADPSGRRLAWRPVGGGLLLSELSEPSGGSLSISSSRRLLPPYSSPSSLDWLVPGRLVYTRLAPTPAGRFMDLFELDLATGTERRLSHGARARFARAGPEGCVYYVRDVIGAGSSLMRMCQERSPERVFTAPTGSHLVGLDVSEVGRIAVSLWVEGRVDLALYEHDELTIVYSDVAVELDPVWVGEEELLFRSDRSGVFDLYRMRLDPGAVQRLTAQVGGSFTPSPAEAGVVFARLGGDGLDLALVALGADPLITTGAIDVSDAREAATSFESGTSFRLKDYSALRSLAPFGWLPRLELVDLQPLSVAASASLLGQDRSGEHAYSLTAGYHPVLVGPLEGAWIDVRYDYRGIDAFDLFQRPDPWGFGVRLGFWPHRPHLRPAREIASGIGVEIRGRRRLGAWLGSARLEAGALHLGSHGGLQPDGRVDLALSRRYADLWGYGTSGPRASLHALWSADGSGGAAAAWLDASRVLAPSGGLPFTTTFALTAGYRPLPPAPVRSGPWALFGTVGARESFPLRLRYADGLAALERLTAEVRFHAGYDGRFIPAADLSLWADTMIRYGAPVSLGGSVGHADGPWYRLGLRVPL